MKNKKDKTMWIRGIVALLLIVAGFSVPRAIAA